MKELGNVRISDDVVKTIAAKAASDIDGVYKLSGGVADEVRKILGNKRPTHGVKVEVGEKECNIEIYLIVEYGYNIAKLSEEVQQAVHKNVVEITGLKVVEVNIFVQDIKIANEPDMDNVYEEEVSL